MNVTRNVVGVVLMFSLTALVGCGDKPSLGSVEGTVTFQGKALPEGTITFVPEKGRSAVGQIKDGKIVDVTCFEANDGAPVGNVKVGIRSYTKQAEDSTARSKSLIPEGYGDPEKSNLKAEIKSGNNELKFDLQ